MTTRTFTDFQQHVANAICTMYLDATSQPNTHDGRETRRRLISIAGAYAYALRKDLAQSGYEIEHDRGFITNRGLQLDDRDFYNHPHAIEEFFRAVRPLYRAETNDS